MVNDKSTQGHAVIIGAGVMGAGIAAHLANVGWRATLLDRVPDDAGTDQKARNRIAQEGLDRALKSRPPQFALPELAAKVRVGNVEDHLAWCHDADWVVEAVAEDMAVKRALFARVAEHAGPDTVVSSNTSGLSLAGMVADCPPAFRARFLGTHFFNPPRYMKPLELIPHAETDPAVFEGFARFADRVLGKRVIRAKDTPGFISTRLGIYAMVKTIEIALHHGLTVEEVDYLTGPLLGRPKSGTFRLADLIGLDITAHIIENLLDKLPDEPAHKWLVIPEVMKRLIDEGRLGAKSGAGFYKREHTGGILTLDLSTGEYRSRIEPEPLSKEIADLPLGRRLKRLWDSASERYRAFLQDSLLATIGYMADATPQVADRIVEVDDALIGGFGWEMGPYHILDALGEIEWKWGVPSTVRLRQEAGQPRFYCNEAGAHYYFDFRSGKMESLPRPPEVLVLKDLKKAGRTVEETSIGSLVDLGDGVLCAEWRTKMNTLDPDVARFLDRARERAEEEFAALVLGGASEHFSAGFNLSLLVGKMEAKDWTWIDATMRDLQQVLQRCKRSRVPLVAAVSGFALGGGCEVALHCAAVQSAFESSIGLPEANVGLMPVAGGVAEMLLRAMEDVPEGTILEPADPFQAVKPVWDNLRSARFSASAHEARKLGYLRDRDGVTIHPDRLLNDARIRALAQADSYSPPQPGTVTVMGESGLARFRWEIHLLRRGRQISEHDAKIADRLAWVLCGGSMVHRAAVSERYLLELEREAFLTLASTEESLARIKHLLETGKALRN